MKSDSSLLMVGMTTYVAPSCSFVITMAVVPYAVISLPFMDNNFEDSYFALSLDQEKRLKRLQSDLKSQVLSVLTQSQQVQLDIIMMTHRGLSLWQGLASLDLTEEQQIEIRNILKFQLINTFRLMNPSQRKQLGRSLPTQIYL